MKPAKKLSRRKGAKVVSLTSELIELYNALDAALFIVEALQNYRLADEAERLRASGAIMAVLSLTQCRLKHLGQVVRGSMSAELLWTRHNSGPGRRRPGDDPDVLLPSK